LARVEKFTTSVQDGIDIRETLRNWHTGDLYVKVFPPNRGSIDGVVMLFDSPADPRDYPYRITWHHEHEEESTLAFFATDWRKNVIGPGVAQATYGGCMMIFPPMHIADIWHEPFFDKADTMEERLLMACCFHSREKHVALMSAAPPGAAWRKDRQAVREAAGAFAVVAFVRDDVAAVAGRPRVERARDPVVRGGVHPQGVKSDAPRCDLWYITDMSRLGSLLDRIIQPESGGFSPEHARYVLSLGFSESERERCLDLSEKAQDGTLSTEEATELDAFLMTNGILTALQSKARRLLKQSSSTA
jgi:hypothetical protein